MYIFNITTNISEEIEKEWIAWMNDTFIPAMLATKKFSKALMTQVEVEEEMGGITYSTQYFTDSKTTLDTFFKEDQSNILQKHTKFRGQYVDFNTTLKVIIEH
ncbi:DUF4286 family protein [Aquimarina agarilytica]|uniref:DUF4286 family protein n=1 Tax=Aquimarina agarilytica TaxID=1087449 RepID=UPI000287B120|nr:DUF4286 family protein [Aquimarina agarilytica]